ncbi:uncharacterized protein BJX67DRAFT_40842 [Aspergillus lucknowensis]|uniref:Uncharacterized protein n=1 Tax=Aspergillus lucknowensis TaxID=176173 RepID=A0ABR4L5I0_9EURO
MEAVSARVRIGLALHDLIRAMGWGETCVPSKQTQASAMGTGNSRGVRWERRRDNPDTRSGQESMRKSLSADGRWTGGCPGSRTIVRHHGGPAWSATCRVATRDRSSIHAASIIRFPDSLRDGDSAPQLLQLLPARPLARLLDPTKQISTSLSPSCGRLFLRPTAPFVPLVPQPIGELDCRAHFGR